MDRHDWFYVLLAFIAVTIDRIERPISKRIKNAPLRWLAIFIGTAAPTLLILYLLNFIFHWK